nr:L367 [uncultured bacterium]
MSEAQVDDSAKVFEIELKKLEVELKRLEIEQKKLDPNYRKAEHRAKNIDMIVKALSVLAVMIGVLVTYVQYSGTASLQRQQLLENEKNEIRAASRESLKPFNEKRILLYTEASNVVAKLANLGEGEERQAARKRFFELYWGELALVEDKQVESAMVYFARALQEYEQNPSSNAELQKQSLNVAHAFRESLKEGLDYPELGTLADKK